MKRLVIPAFLLTLVLVFAARAHAINGPDHPVTPPAAPSPLGPDDGPIDPLPPLDW
jgi:hypothetical protein